MCPCLQPLKLVAAGQSDDEGAEDDQLEEDDADNTSQNGDGMMEPKDLARTHFQPHDGEDSGTSADEEEMEEYGGEEPLSDEDGFGGDTVQVSGTEVAPPAAPKVLSHQGHEKQYHVSPEWVELGNHGEHLLRLPPLFGVGVNRHPSKNFWSARFPQEPIKTASWGDTRSPLKCLVLCLKHVVKLFLDTKPPDADVWRAQLHDLSQVAW